ncbi:MAG: glycosyltransferase [Actinobacteria bacterium]|nr:glycosyltransferase [Actinomycetota bacterium]
MAQDPRRGHWIDRNGERSGIYACNMTHWQEPYWRDPASVSVIITCHDNYGMFVIRCLSSVFTQTYPNKEILLIDDGTYNMPNISNFNVKHYKVDFKNGNASRNYGAARAKGKYILFIDADDWIANNFILSKLVYHMKDEISVVGGHYQRVLNEIKQPPEDLPLSFDKEKMFIRGYIQTTALIRKKDFLGFDDKLPAFQEWDLWARMLNAGRKFTYLPEIILFHGEHSYNRSRAVLTGENYKKLYRQLIYKNMLLTIGTSFSGKSWCFDKYFKRLSELRFPKNRTRLVFFDDSNDKQFSNKLRKKIKKIRSRYKEIVLLSGGVLPIDYDAYPVPKHLAQIYNKMRGQLIKGSHVFMWEDDELPPKDVIEKLSNHLWYDIGIVSGYTKSRQRKLPLAWYYTDKLYQAFPNGKDTEDIGATSLGCVLIPTYYVKIIAFKDVQDDLVGHDIIFSRDIAKLGKKILIDWRIKCLHFDKRGLITPRIKLNLGSGYKYMLDYINIDLEKGAPVDERLDLTKSLPYPDESIDLIETHHLIEHLNVPRINYMQEFVKIFKDWHRVLKTNGELIIECPDFDGLVRLYHKKPKDDLLKHFYGMGSREGHHHYIGWNYDRLKRTLNEAGFMRIKRKKARDYHAKDSPCLRVEAAKC